MEQQANSPDHTLVTLRQWVVGNSSHRVADAMATPQNQEAIASIFKTTTIAYGLANLLNQAYQQRLIVSTFEMSKSCDLDNFMVRLGTSTSAHWGDLNSFEIEGVEMISPPLSLKFSEIHCLNDGLVGAGNGSGVKGRCLELQINGSPPVETSGQNGNEQSLCCLLGMLLHELFSGEPLPTKFRQQSRDSNVIQSSVPSAAGNGADNEEHVRKKQALQSPISNRVSTAGGGQSRESCSESFSFHPIESKSSWKSLREFGCPFAICLLVGSLLECGSERSSSNHGYDSLGETCKDLNRLIIEPNKFLFPSHMDLSVAKLPLMSESKVYGREKEIDSITEAFHRVSSGKSEALFIAGESGSGKTKLVQSLVGRVSAVGGIVVMEKFDLFEQEPYSTVLSAFNSLCLAISSTLDWAQLQRLAVELMNEFYINFSFLAQLLPGIRTICPHLPDTSSQEFTMTNMNLSGVKFLLQRFVKIVSSKSHPVMFFLDDMQWSDTTSLGLIQAIFSDGDCSDCFFFVGSYRSSDVELDHPIVGLRQALDARGVRSTWLNLEGLSRTDVRDITSDALSVLPHLCLPLSDMIFHNTQGNPLFVWTCLESLAKKKLIQFSTSEQRWGWDLDKIRSETLGNDVISLILSKMSGATDDLKLVLKTLACFGNKIEKELVDALALTGQFSDLLQSLNQAVDDGYIERINGNFRFIHDSVKEAAHGLIPSSTREQYHFNLGLSLHSVYERQRSDKLVFLIVDQFKKAPNCLKRNHLLSFSMPELFAVAGSNAMKIMAFPQALSYLELSVSMLPNDPWKESYDLCLRIFSLLAKSSYACGHIEDAKTSLRQILENGRCVEDKLDANYTLFAFLFNSNKKEEAYTHCCKVLSQLGHEIPNALSPNEAAEVVGSISDLLKNVSEEDLLAMNETDDQTHAQIKFFCLMSVIAYQLKPQVMPSIVFSMLQLSLKNGVSEYSCLGFVGFSAMLLCTPAIEDIPKALKAGKLGMAFQKRYDMTKQLAIIHTFYYGFAAAYDEPFQTCAEMHRRGYEVGMSTGDASYASWNPNFCIRSSFLAGEKLNTLLKENNYYISQAKLFGHPNVLAFHEEHRETLLCIIGKMSPVDAKGPHSSTPVCKLNYYFHLAIRSFWLGHQKRFEHAANTFFSFKGIPVNCIHRSIMMFYQGVTAYQGKIGENKKRKIGKQSIDAMKPIAELCGWNFMNKLKLLQAEKLSFNSQREKAQESYSAAIAAARRSNFIHEEGLACELAGSHFSRIGSDEEALAYLKQAKKCYSKWGSQVKVDIIGRQIETLESKSSS